MPKDKKPQHPTPVKNRKVKIHNHKFETRTILVPPDLIPCGPAFAYDEGRKEIIPVTINGYHSELVEVESGYFIMKLYGYRCNVYNPSNHEELWGFWPSEDVYPTKAEAERQTKFIAVDLPNEVYQKALGIDEKGKRVHNNKEEDDEESLEDCELPICCSNISEVRDQLIRCMQQKGLNKWRVDLVKDYLQSSHPEFLEERPDHSVSNLSNLDKILAALGILKRKQKSDGK